MKKNLSIYLLSLLSLASVFSCSKSDITSLIPGSSLIGSWTFYTASATGCTDPLNNYSELCSTSCGILTFTASTWTFTQTGSPTETGTYSVSGSTITATKTGDSPKTSTFSIIANILSMVEVKSNGCTETTTFNKN